MDFNTLLVVCPLVFLGGFVDAVGGGGALIAVPAYLLAGIPPHMAIGTNKLSSCMGKAASIFKLARSGFVDWKLACLLQVLRQTNRIRQPKGAGNRLESVRYLQAG